MCHARAVSARCNRASPRRSARAARCARRHACNLAARCRCIKRRIVDNTRWRECERLSARRHQVLKAVVPCRHRHARAVRSSDSRHLACAALVYAHWAKPRASAWWCNLAKAARASESVHAMALRSLAHSRQVLHESASRSPLRYCAPLRSSRRCSRSCCAFSVHVRHARPASRWLRRLNARRRLIPASVCLRRRPQLSRTVCDHARRKANFASVCRRRTFSESTRSSSRCTTASRAARACK